MMSTENISAVLPLQNESERPVKILLEPISEYFFIQPGEKIQVHAVFNSNTKNLTFTVAPNDDCLIIYAPGEIVGFVDSYVTRNGMRLAPDGN